MSPPHPLRTLPCETTVFEAGKPAHGDVANGISREAMLRERLTARLVDRQSHFQIESRGAHTAPHSPLETQREETLRPKISCSALQDYAMVASPTAKQLYADRAPVSSAPWSHAGQISPSRTSHARTLGYFARSLAFEDARDIDIGPMAINSQANDSLDGPGKVLPGPAQSNEVRFNRAATFDFECLTRDQPAHQLPPPPISHFLSSVLCIRAAHHCAL
jgi:hypothetical protein